MKVVVTHTQLAAMDKYSMKGICQLLQGDIDTVTWHKFVWNRFVIPKHMFFGWLVMNDRL